jgi:hypothetical protein
MFCTTAQPSDKTAQLEVQFFVVTEYRTEIPTIMRLEGLGHAGSLY